MVDASLAAHTRINHRQQRRWHLHEPNSPEYGRGDEAGEISDDAASKCQHEIAAFDSAVEHSVENLTRAGKTLARFPCGDCDAYDFKSARLDNLRDVRPMRRIDVPVTHDPNTMAVWPASTNQVTRLKSNSRLNVDLGRSGG